MTHRFRQLGACIPLVASLLTAAACNGVEPVLRLENAWIAEAPPTSTVMAGYMDIYNPGNKPIEISKVSSTDFSSIEIHRTVEEDGVARMLRQTGIKIAASSSFELKPGDYHLMMFNPIKHFTAGDSSQLIFTFVDGSTAVFSIPVKKATGYASNGHH